MMKQEMLEDTVRIKPVKLYDAAGQLIWHLVKSTRRQKNKV